jgi:hypothetical protein
MTDSKPAAGMPLPEAMAGNFQEAVRWFNQLWAGVADGGSAAHGGPVPSALMPTLDVKEIDKRIADLRSVEHWLQLNQGLLHSTIQGLEMQRNTLSAWQSFGAAATGAPAPSTSSSSASPAATASGSDPSAMAAFQPALWWATLQQQFAQMAASAAAAQSPEAVPGTTPPASAAASAAAGDAQANPGKPKPAAARTGRAGPGAR